MRHGGVLGTAMTDRRFDDSPRGQLAEAFQALSEAAVRAGWGEGDVARALCELAEEYLIEISGKAITDGALHPRLADVIPIRKH
jgi:hypothetical protein